MASECHQWLDLGSATSVLEFWLRKNSEPRLKLQEKVYLESRTGRKSEPVGCRFRKQVTQAEEGPLELRKDKGKANRPGGRPGGRKNAEGWREEKQHQALSLEVLGGSQSNTHQLSRCVLLGSWSLLIGRHQSRGSLVSAAGPDVSHSTACLVLLLFCAWSWNTTEA